MSLQALYAADIDVSFHTIADFYTKKGMSLDKGKRHVYGPKALFVVKICNNTAILSGFCVPATGLFCPIPLELHK